MTKEGEGLNSEEVMTSLKIQMQLHVEQLQKLGVRRQNIEIDVHSFLKSLIYPKRT